MRKFFVLLICFVGMHLVSAQSHNNYLEVVAGLSFYNEDLAIISQDVVLPEEFQPEDYFRFQIIPKVNFPINNSKLVVGPHVGFGYERFKIAEQNNEVVHRNLYKVGGHAQYEKFNIYGLRPYIEIGANYNIYQTSNSAIASDNQTVDYWKSYMDIGLRVRASESFAVSLLFKDFATYHSASRNFEREDDFTIGPFLSNFIQFPHFSVRYKL
ncbi:hypothetical protein [Nonlabens spongiae]|nr:hypothetical protein [Nonlabens spongiae]